MGGPRLFVAALALAGLTAGCSEQQNDVPSGPSFAPPVQNGCDAGAVSTLVKAEFGASSSQSSLATTMKNYGGKTAQATYVGYRLLDAIATKYDIAANQAAGTLNASKLTIALLKCMNVGSASVPASFETELGSTGAYAVRGWPGDARTVTSHDGTWVLEPPSGDNWEAITELATTGLPDSVGHLFLAYGHPGDADAFTDDELVGTVFDWSTLPEATFSGTGVVVGECTQPSNYIQHNRAGDGPEVLGFILPSCAPENGGLMPERDPRTFAERVVRWLSPKPAFAALVATVASGGGKSKLSPFGLINPGNVDLEPEFSWKKSGNTVGKPFSPTPKYQILSGGGTLFRQDYVLIWLEVLGNEGTNVKICNNWAYTNADGRAHFPEAYLNKSGGYTIRARTTGTISKPDAVGDDIPVVPAGESVLSPLINVKNGPVPACPNTYTGTGDVPPPPAPNAFPDLVP